jgi:hypothetical protein
MESNNEALRVVNTALEAITTDNTNESAAFTHLRWKMHDYQVAVDGFINANNADIIDHRRLIDIVGGRDLIGSQILQQLEINTRDRTYAITMIEHYRQVRNSVEWWQKINPFDWTYSNARRNQRCFEAIRNTTDEIIRYLNQKIEDYGRIEQASRNLFTVGRELRSATKRGIDYIFAHGFLTELGIPPLAQDVRLVLQKLNDQRMMAQINALDERFSLERWNSLGTLEMRKAFVQEYADEIERIMGINIEPNVRFDMIEAWSHFGGIYAHGGSATHGLPPQTVWVNPARVDPESQRCNFVSVLSIVRHEVRHAFQHAVMDERNNFPLIARATYEALWDNRRNYIQPPRRFELDEDYKGAHLQDFWNDREQRYHNQIIEVDAFGFGDGLTLDMPGWSGLQ